MTATAERIHEPAGHPALSARARRRAELTSTDLVVRAVLAVAGLLPAAALAFLVYQMVKEAYPAVIFNGTHFFTGKKFTMGNLYGATEVRNGQKAPLGATYGVLPLLFGTVISSVLALILAVPVSVGGAIILVEKIPERAQNALGVFLELLAGIPSVIFGLWGIYTFGPLLSRTVFRWISDLGIPWFTGPTGAGEGLASASVVLAVMIVPIIASITRELVKSVPEVSKEGAAALGLTATETVRYVTIPFIRTGIIAAAVLGWARALGETIAVLIISGNLLNAYPHSVFGSFSSMAGTIAAFIDSALTDPTGMALHALAEVGLLLVVITILTNLAGRLLTRRFSDAGLPVGRGV